jgi:tRNA (guanine10-N2)-methyltransferase
MVGSERCHHVKRFLRAPCSHSITAAQPLSALYRTSLVMQSCSTPFRALIQFFDGCWTDFRLAELHALLQLNGVDPASLKLTSDESQLDGNFLIVDVPSKEIARKLCERSVLIKTIHELWASGPSLSAVVDATKTLPVSFIQPYLAAENSWSFQCDGFCRKLQPAVKEEFRGRFKPILGFKGPISINRPAVDLWLILDYSVRYQEEEEAKQRAKEETTSTVFTSAKCNSYPSAEASEEDDPTSADVPTYLGVLISKGGMREELRKYSLKQRLYLGPTSLDDSLAFLLGNISSVRAGELVFDPFVGTASILVAMAHFGAVTAGSDIDPRVLRGLMYAGKKNDINRQTIMF